MNDNEALVIGGVCDGAVFTADMPHRVGYNTRGMGLLSVTDPSTPVPEVPRSHYRLEWIRSGERKFGLYIEVGMSHEQALERILTRYHLAA